MWHTWFVVVLVSAVVVLCCIMYSRVNTPVDQPLPEYISDPPGTMERHYKAHNYSTHVWGSATTDGPDRCLPGHCYWTRGLLECRSHLPRCDEMKTG